MYRKEVKETSFSIMSTVFVKRNRTSFCALKESHYARIILRIQWTKGQLKKEWKGFSSYNNKNYICLNSSFSDFFWFFCGQRWQKLFLCVICSSLSNKINAGDLQGNAVMETFPLENDGKCILEGRRVHIILIMEIQLPTKLYLMKHNL